MEQSVLLEPFLTQLDASIRLVLTVTEHMHTVHHFKIYFIGSTNTAVIISSMITTDDDNITMTS